MQCGLINIHADSQREMQVQMLRRGRVVETSEKGINSSTEQKHQPLTLLWCLGTLRKDGSSNSWVLDGHLITEMHLQLSANTVHNSV